MCMQVIALLGNVKNEITISTEKQRSVADCPCGLGLVESVIISRSWYVPRKQSCICILPALLHPCFANVFSLPHADVAPDYFLCESELMVQILRR